MKKRRYRYGHTPGKRVDGAAKKLIKGVQGYKVRPSKWIKDVLKKQKEA